MGTVLTGARKSDTGHRRHSALWVRTDCSSFLGQDAGPNSLSTVLKWPRGVQQTMSDLVFLSEEAHTLPKDVWYISLFPPLNKPQYAAHGHTCISDRGGSIMGQRFRMERDGDAPLVCNGRKQEWRLVSVPHVGFLWSGQASVEIPSRWTSGLTRTCANKMFTQIQYGPPRQD